MKYALALHAGAGTILKKNMSAEKERQYVDALKTALELGETALKMGRDALSVVEMVVCYLEDCPLFNAGKGSVFNAEGKHDMDASIMEGKDLKAGAVAGITGVKNPISLARLVMEKSGHVFLVGNGAMAFAKMQDVKLMDEEYFHNEYRYQQWLKLRDSAHFQLDHSDDKDGKFGTVGAVALDVEGNLAAATSTGGMTNKRFGRVGDSPIIGAGTYANNATCAVSCTGSGEYFMRSVVAYDVSCLMRYKNLSLQAACDTAIHQNLANIKGKGGLIAIDKYGNIAMPFNTRGMYRAAVSSKQQLEIGIYDA